LEDLSLLARSVRSLKDLEIFLTSYVPNFKCLLSISLPFICTACESLTDSLLSHTRTHTDISRDTNLHTHGNAGGAGFLYPQQVPNGTGLTYKEGDKVQVEIDLEANGTGALPCSSKLLA
jgi:hypothetical protein